MAVKLSEGAEAVIYAVRIFGKNLVVKERRRKAYREEALYLSIRSSRTKKEAKLLLLARSSGAAVPAVVAYGKYSIYMQKLEGTLLRDMLKEAGLGLFELAGRQLAVLHRAGIAHGDFTPANLLVSNGTVFVIDFGLASLSKDAEEFALDVLLMKRSISSEQYASFIAGYSDFERSDDVLRRLNEIELRGRYQKRTVANV
ncbi:MAG: KEOPS complex kinase/ATPase Bud32 [Candidatus Micrarchaeaceae archaeon]